jgi:hypothetical protein
MRRFEDWLKSTGRDRRIDWGSVSIEQDDPAATVVRFRMR